MDVNFRQKIQGVCCLAAVALLAEARPATAVLNYYIYEDAGNVVVKTSGSLTLPSPITAFPCGNNGAIFSPIILCTGSDAVLNIYPWLSSSSFGGSAALFPANSVSGISTGFDNTVFGISPGYVNGTPIDSSATFNGQSLAGLGFTTLGVVGPWILDGTGDTVNVVIGSPPPVPGPLPLLGAGAAFGFSRRLRRRVNHRRVAPHHADSISA